MKYDGPVVLAILDGVGLAPSGPGNAVSVARTDFLARASQDYLHLALDASGEAVGLVPGQMGNSEVGHNVIGSGQIIKQGIARINEAFETGEVFKSDAWQMAIRRLTLENTTLHFAGIFSNGGVHSHIGHLEKMIAAACMEGVSRIRLHAVFDGRDVAPQSEPKFIEWFENLAEKFPQVDIKIADGGGRMKVTADRYENDWQMVKRGFDMMVKGEADYYFESAKEGVIKLREDNPDLQDQDLPGFVVVTEDGYPVGKIEKGDVVIYFDFRADRAVEISQALTQVDFPYFNRGDFDPEKIYFVGMTEYNIDQHIPKRYLVSPVEIKQTLHEFLGEKSVSQLAVSETVKFGHITYYFDGNSYEKAASEEFIKIESYEDAFDEKPEMRSVEITDAVLDNLEKYKFVRINYPGGDMVGHTANIDATVKAIEAVDQSLAKIAEKVDKLGGVLVIIADHGNAEELLDEEGHKKTSHTTNKVPCIFYDNTKNRSKYRLADLENPGLANIAATVATLLGESEIPENWKPSLIVL